MVAQDVPRRRRNGASDRRTILLIALPPFVGVYKLIGNVQLYFKFEWFFQCCQEAVKMLNF
jgi:hypothetical protein